MQRHLLTFLIFVCLLFRIGPAGSQTPPKQAPIVCNIQDNVEDAACQQELKGLFTRKGDELTLELDNGKSKTYTGNRAACDGDNTDAEKCLVYTVRRYFPQIRSYVVEQGYYECGNYLIVNRHSGTETTMKEIPVLSPNAKYLILTDQSDACDRDFEIGLWSTQTDTLKLEFQYNAKRYENWEVKGWKDDTHIEMKAFIGDDPSYQQSAELVRKESGSWSLVLGKKLVSKPLQ